MDLSDIEQQRATRRLIGRTPLPTPQELRRLPAVVPLWPTAGRAWGLTRSASYALARRGEFPCRVVRVGARLRVVRADLLASLGIREEGGSEEQEEVDGR